MNPRKTRNIVLGLLAGGAALWGINYAVTSDEAETASTATTRRSHLGGGFFFLGGRSFFGMGGGGGNATRYAPAPSSGVSRGGFGSSGSTGAS